MDNSRESAPVDAGWDLDPLLCPCQGEGWLVGQRCPHHSEGAPTPDDPRALTWRTQKGEGGLGWHLIRQYRAAYRHYQELCNVPKNTFAARVKCRMPAGERSQWMTAKLALIQARQICGEVLEQRERMAKDRLSKTKIHKASTDVDRLQNLLAGRPWGKSEQTKLPI